jgi:hypothetical protein
MEKEHCIKTELHLSQSDSSELGGVDTNAEAQPPPPPSANKLIHLCHCQCFIHDDCTHLFVNFCKAL